MHLDRHLSHPNLKTPRPDKGWRHVAWAVAGVAAVLLLGTGPATAAEVKLPDGFVREVLAGPELTEPVNLEFAPDGALWVCGRQGHVWRLDTTAKTSHLVGKIPTEASGDRGLHGFAFHPEFQRTHQVFAFYNAPTNTPSKILSRVSRFEVKGAGTGSTLDLGSEKRLVEFAFNDFGQHVGGALLAHPKEKALYISTGDNNEIGRLKEYCNDPENQAQSLKDLRGKVLRIGFDGSIPADNPFVRTPGARGEIYTRGHRQPWQLSYDAPTGWVLLAENGGDQNDDHDEVNRLSPGLNCGWPRVFADGWETLTRTNRVPGFPAPWFSYLRNTGASSTGALIYRPPARPGAAATPYPARFHGGLFYADYNRKSVRFAPVDPKAEHPGKSEAFAQNFTGGPVALRLGPDGALYLAEYGGWFQGTTNDTISRIVWKKP